MQNHNLKIPLLLWMRLLHELRQRSGNGRESGAFLLGKTGSNKITRFICYDDLDPKSLDRGIITFDGSYYILLWKLCNKFKLKVLADVHTHPSSWTGQSHTDKTHPMIAQKGHFAIIIPNYASKRLISLAQIGIYEYLGDHTWKTCSKGKLKFTLL